MPGQSCLCCLSVKDDLPNLFLPYGQVGVGIKGWLEAAIHSFRHLKVWRDLGPGLLDISHVYQYTSIHIMCIHQYTYVGIDQYAQVYIGIHPVYMGIREYTPVYVDI